MKKCYLILLFACFTGLVHSQTKTWSGPDNGSWSEATHWVPEGIPGSTNDVIIPPSSIVNIDGQADADTVTVQNDAIMLISGTSEYPEFVCTLLTIENGAVLNYEEGNITATMEMNGTMNVVGNEQKQIWYNTQNINGVLNFTDEGELGLRNNVFNITSTGECIMENRGSIYIAAFTAELYNEGLIEKMGTDTFSIATPFENLNGEISVDGVLISENNTTLINGIYNVSNESKIIFETTLNLEGTISGELNGPFRTEGELRPSTDNLTAVSFSGTSYFEWAGGTLGFGNLTNNSHLVVSGDASLPVQIGAVNLINNDTLDIQTTEFILLNSIATINNSVSGTINLLQDNEIGGGTIINAGMINKNEAEGTSELSTLENNDGTIQVESGALLVNNGGSLNNGTYNVSEDAEFVSNTGTTFILSGNLTGTLDGPFSIRSWFNIPTDSEVTLNFEGESTLDWYSGNMVGGGTLTVQSPMNILNVSGFATQILSSTTLKNETTITMLEDSFISTSSDGVFYNTEMGVLDIKSDESIYTLSTSNFINDGLVKKTAGEGVFSISLPFEHNSTGYIQSESGTLSVTNMQGNGNFSGTSTIGTSTLYVIEGLVAPGDELGLSIGTLTFANGFRTGTEATINIGIEGLVSGEEFDAIEVTGNGIVSGDLDIDLFFAPELEDEFIILNATGTVTCVDFPTAVTGTFEGQNYTFDVICNESDITLKVASVGVEQWNLGQEYSIYPNPMNETSTLELAAELGSNISYLTISNSLGQTVSQQNILPGARNYVINRNGLTSGMYILTLHSNKEIILSTKLKIE